MKKTDKITLKTKRGMWLLYVNGVEVGSAGVSYGKSTEKMYRLPKKTMACGAMEIYSKYRGKGYGSRFVKLVENKAKSMGMRYFAGTNIENTRFFRSAGYGSIPGRSRIMIKSLITGRAPGLAVTSRVGWVEKKKKITRGVRPLKVKKSRIVRRTRGVSVVEKTIKATQGKRTRRAKKADNRKTAENSFPGPATIPFALLKKWAKHPNRYDIWGVDTRI